MRAWALFLFLGFAGLLSAAEGSTYLRLPVTAKAASLAGCYGAVEGDVEAVWYNPAGLAGAGNAQALFTHMTWALDLSGDYLAFAYPLKDTQVLAVELDRNSTTDTYRDESGNETGSFEVSEMVMGAVYAGQIDAFSWGLALKAINETLEMQSGAGLMADLGAVGHLLDQRMVAGLSLQNIGWAPSLGAGNAASAPMTLRMSVAERPWAWLRLFEEYRLDLGQPGGSFAFGFQARTSLGPADLAFRSGYDMGMSDLGGITGLSMGGGLRYRLIEFDYAYTPLNGLGAGHRMTMKVFFDP